MVASLGAVGALQSDAPRRQLMHRAATVGQLMRSCVALLVALVTLADPASPTSTEGNWLLVVLAVWSTYRIATRSHRTVPTAIDFGLVVAVCVGIPALVPGPDFYLSNSAPQAIAGTAVVSFAVSVPVRLSLPITLGIAAAYAWGSAGVVGWAAVASIAAMYYFALQWLTAALIRVMVLRVADAVERARAARRAAELDQEVNDAVREYEREQLALLHDTAASTLLMVGQGATLSPQRLAAQARRDLDVLGRGPRVDVPQQVELVGALRECAEHIATPVEFDGLGETWLPGETAMLVTAAAREAMNNVDRHAHAGTLSIRMSADAVILEDDGVGFDPQAFRSGHGVSDSIVERMSRAGGQATIRSAPGAGTTVELSWSRNSASDDTDSGGSDPDQLIERIRNGFALALTAYALANLAFAVPQAGAALGGQPTNSALGVVAATATLAAAAASIRSERRLVTALAATTLIAVTIIQPLVIPPELVGGYVHWAQNAIGWCAMPLVLGLPTRRGAAALVGFWIVGAVVEFACLPQSSVLVNIGLGTASILSVQLFALLFNGLVRDAAVDAHRETATQQQLITHDRVSQVLRTEYQRRYARLVGNVVPLLRELSDTTALDEGLQRRARAESRRLRALFDQETTFDHPLMQQVRRLVDVAEARNVDVVIDLAGDLPVLTSTENRRLLEPLAPFAEYVRSSMRLVVTATSEEVSVSVVCDGVDAPSPLVTNHDIDVVTAQDVVWAVVTHRL